MELDDFVKNFAFQFDETDPELIKFNTNFRDLEEWSSIIALSIIAMVDEEYDISLSGEDIIKSNTVEDIYNIVKSRI